MTVDSNRVGADSARTLSKLFTSLNQEDQHELAGLFALMHVRTVSRGDILFRPGVSCERFAVVIDGSIRVSLIHSGREKTLYRVEPGQLCVHTLTNLLNDQEYQAQAVAEVDSQVGWMDASAFRVAYSESNALQRLVVASLSERCFHFVRDIHDLCFRSVTARLSEKLLEMAGHEGIVEASHANLAAAIGSSREVVSRQLKAFANDGLLDMKRGAITLIDFESLLALSSTES